MDDYIRRQEAYWSQPLFTVERHGGKRTDVWRVIRRTPNEHTAWTAYLDAGRQMRRGAVRILNPDGSVKSQDVAGISSYK